ncbi:hypothetical protein FRX31_015081 [Thalictrum thalictroides]|uniref:Uncharacterized protein n=1 Tax=Thalictrum thalictroides TaxID=46969 RepID=A0A7J6WDB7_THATH|nr:hypothetical protein FRX31_015081 [Thalictrum thalictroides]
MEWLIEDPFKGCDCRLAVDVDLIENSSFVVTSLSSRLSSRQSHRALLQNNITNSSTTGCLDQLTHLTTSLDN